MDKKTKAVEVKEDKETEETGVPNLALAEKKALAEKDARCQHKKDNRRSVPL